MSTRDDFEAWVIQHPHNKGLSRVQKYPSVPVALSDAYADPSVELAWQAYQAGQADRKAFDDRFYQALRKRFADVVPGLCSGSWEDIWERVRDKFKEGKK
jgi:hypothetical protein